MEVINISSDSSTPPSPVVDSKYDRIAALINKYNSDSNTFTRNECISDSDEETVLLDKEKNFCNNIPEKCSSSNSSLSQDELCFFKKAVLAKPMENISDSDDSTTTESVGESTQKRTQIAKSTKSVTRKRKAPLDSEAKKLEKAALKQKKREEREQRKQEEMREKQLKRILSAANKNVKPNECIKFIIVYIDPEILNEPCGTDILTHLRSMEVQYKVEAQIVPYTVTWKRQTQNHLLDDSGQLITTTEVIGVENVLMLMDWKKFVEHIHENSLLTNIKTVTSMYENVKPFLVIYGLESYFKYVKSKKKKEISEATQRTSKTDKIYAEAPLITKRSVEYALTELQLFCNCCYRMAETPQDVAIIIGQFSKSIAQIPYKLEKNKKYQEIDWYMAGDKKDTVSVDKDGNGLKRLWNQQLCCFPLARLEIAEAIAAQYPTPAALMRAYENCIAKEDGKKLLQDIPIRRAAGPLTSVRKIGLELSKKVFTFFTSIDENAIL